MARSLTGCTCLVGSAARALRSDAEAARHKGLAADRGGAAAAKAARDPTLTVVQVGSSCREQTEEGQPTGLSLSLLYIGRPGDGRLGLVLSPAPAG